ncbi:hypothetical protein TRFO_06757 [Tritrichomonas foetus]|uniref:Myb-like DNA-binding domain containing protein n=1 Tax=Tritrichomonas foetus TaxID=1144522 RepID=A0A1J4JVG0_9EUKA|nr:hypothetical protein TRFO_06756 [Tritrichomonas foetus]OHT03114.1 hypothetical protein TRFO_06757 [Tritrichomonas foetus]|eukprot:OHT03113.1 hypothetical protein TRFO_06756 [Tritrichomonas foetus]
MFSINAINQISSINTNNRINFNNNNIQQNKVSITRQRSRIPFSHEEDETLRSLVHTYGENNWYFVASQMPNRSVRQCRERWQLFLSSGVTKSKWTREEDELLLSKHREFGSQWKTLERFFKGRTSYNIRNRFISLSRSIQKFNSNNPQNSVVLTHSTNLLNSINSKNSINSINSSTDSSKLSSPLSSTLSSPEETHQHHQHHQQQYQQQQEQEHATIATTATTEFEKSKQNQYFTLSFCNQFFFNDHTYHQSDNHHDDEEEKDKEEKGEESEKGKENQSIFSSTENLDEPFYFDDMIGIFEQEQEQDFDQYFPEFPYFPYFQDYVCENDFYSIDVDY